MELLCRFNFLSSFFFLVEITHFAAVCAAATSSTAVL